MLARNLWHCWIIRNPYPFENQGRGGGRRNLCYHWLAVLCSVDSLGSVLGWWGRGPLPPVEGVGGKKEYLTIDLLCPTPWPVLGLFLGDGGGVTGGVLSLKGGGGERKKSFLPLIGCVPPREQSLVCSWVMGAGWQEGGGGRERNLSYHWLAVFHPVSSL